MNGLLWKSTSSNHTKWSRRCRYMLKRYGELWFCVLKECFLFVYAETERRDHDKRAALFNDHPKSVVPIANVSVTEQSTPTQPFVLVLMGGDFSGEVAFGFDSALDRTRWMNAFADASKISGSNLKMMRDMVQSLRRQGAEIATEKQELQDRYALQAERQTSEQEELERIRSALDREKNESEKLAQNLGFEQQRIRQELKETVCDLEKVAVEKEQLREMTAVLNQNLRVLQDERTLYVSEIKRESGLTDEELAHLAQPDTTALTIRRKRGENNNGDAPSKLMIGETAASPESSTEEENPYEILIPLGSRPEPTVEESQLRASLISVDARIANMRNELVIASQRLHEKELVADQLNREKEIYSTQTADLEAAMIDLTEQNASIHSQLQAEIKSRRDAEKRLAEAEAALDRLANAVVAAPPPSEPAPRLPSSGRKSLLSNGAPPPVPSERDAKVAADVQTLKSFFERIGGEEKQEFETRTVGTVRRAAAIRSTHARTAESVRSLAPHIKRRQSVLGSGVFNGTSKKQAAPPAPHPPQRSNSSRLAVKPASPLLPR